jgi:DNA-binding protein HU-beta
MSDTYNRKSLVAFLAKKHELSNAAAERIVLDTFADITKALKKGQVVTMFPFGTFQVKKRAARKGRNPKTGAAVRIPAKKIVRFKAYVGLKSAVGR